MIEELFRFVTIVDEGSITKASKKLFLTQPALSLSLERLENALQLKLIKRNTRHMTVTADGIAIYTVSKKILSLWEGMKNTITKTPLSIGMYDNASLRSASFFSTEKDNKYSFDITIDSSTKLQQYLKQGILDLCICVIHPTQEKLPEAILVKKIDEPLIPVSRKRWDDTPLSEIPFILYNNGSLTREHINVSFKKQNITPHVVAQSTSISFMKELAILKKGVALLPKNVVQYELKNKDLVEQILPIGWKRTVGLYLPKGGSLEKESKIVQDLWESFIKWEHLLIQTGIQ